MPFPNIVVGPAALFHYKRSETNTLAAAVQLTNAGEVTEGTEVPAVGIDGATRIQASTAYNLALVHIGAHPVGGLACTIPPTNYAFTTTSGKNVIKVAKTVPAYTLALGLLVNDALAAVCETPLSVRNGASGTAEVVCYYEPSAKAVTRSSIVSLMTGVTTYGYDRLQFAETTGDTSVNFSPDVTTVERNAGTNMNLVTGIGISITASLLASGKEDLASVLNGIATKSGGVKTKQSAAFGLRGLGVPSARPIELVGPGDTPGAEDSMLLLSALKLSNQQISKTYSKTNPSALPVTFESAEDTLLQGVHGQLLYFAN
jgi:hypothetical protein